MIELDSVKYGMENIYAEKNLSFSVNGKGIHGIFCESKEAARAVAELLAGCREPACGSVMIEENGATAHRAKIGCVFSDMPYYNDITVYETLLFVGRAKKIEPDKLARQIKEAMSLVGIERLASTRVARISQKGRRLLSLAQSLLGNPDVLIFENITDGLDEKVAAEIKDVIEMLKSMKCVAIISSNENALLDICTDAKVVFNGELKFDGSTEELVERLAGEKRISVALKGSDEEIALAQCKVLALNGASSVTVDADKNILAISMSDEHFDRERVLSACESAGCSIKSISVCARAISDVFGDEVSERGGNEE